MSGKPQSFMITVCWWTSVVYPSLATTTLKPTGPGSSACSEMTLSLLISVYSSAAGFPETGLFGVASGMDADVALLLGQYRRVPLGVGV